MTTTAARPATTPRSESETIIEATDVVKTYDTGRVQVRALRGVSLTVNRVDGREFEVNVIPHTLGCTTLGAARQGDSVNLEIDVLARYVDRLNQ